MRISCDSSQNLNLYLKGGLAGGRSKHLEELHHTSVHPITQENKSYPWGPGVQTVLSAVISPGAAGGPGAFRVQPREHEFPVTSVVRKCKISPTTSMRSQEFRKSVGIPIPIEVQSNQIPALVMSSLPESPIFPVETRGSHSCTQLEQSFGPCPEEALQGTRRLWFISFLCKSPDWRK